MLHPGTQKLFDEASEDHIFQGELLLAGEDMHEPDPNWEEAVKAMYATTYMGYLLAQSKYNQVDYYG